MDRLLCEINRTVSAARHDGADRLAPYLLAAYRRRYQTILDGGWAANPDHHAGQRGRRRRPKHVNLLDRLDTHRDEVLRFATDLRVPFTNNGLGARHPAHEDPVEGGRMPAHHGRREGVLPHALLSVHRRQAGPIQVRSPNHAPRRQPLAASDRRSMIAAQSPSNQVSSY
jgi:hypothetical protein